MSHVSFVIIILLLDNFKNDLSTSFNCLNKRKTRKYKICILLLKIDLGICFLTCLGHFYFSWNEVTIFSLASQYYHVSECLYQHSTLKYILQIILKVHLPTMITAELGTQLYFQF